MQDWRSHPGWGPVGVFIGVLSLLPPAPIFVKTIIFILIFAASAYAFFGGRRRRKPVTSDNPFFIDTKTLPPEALMAQRPWEPLPQQPSHTVSAAPNTSTPIEYSWKDSIIGIIMMAIIIGLPGFLLVRSAVSWQHIIGIILLVVFGLWFLFGVFGPKGADALERFASRQDRVTIRYNQLASKLTEAEREKRQE